MSKLLCNVTKFSGGNVPNAPPPGCAPSTNDDCAAVTRDLVFQK